MDVRQAAHDLALAIAMDRACQWRWRKSNARTGAAVNSGVLTKQEASILHRSALTIDAADRFGQVRPTILDCGQGFAFTCSLISEVCQHRARQQRFPIIQDES